jgi:broad specificity phosphatase PhoE
MLQASVPVSRIGAAFLVVALGVSLPARAADESVDHGVRVTADALAALRQGGFVVIMSHGPVAYEATDRDADRLDSCAHQRSLTDTGRLMASGVGKLLRREQIRIGVVMSSRYCRAVETAERIAEHGYASKLRRMEELNEVRAAVTGADERHRVDVLRRLAGGAPESGTNTLVVTHRSNMQAAFGAEFASVADGELAIFRPDVSAGVNPYRLAYRLKVEDLARFTRASKRGAGSPES